MSTAWLIGVVATVAVGLIYLAGYSKGYARGYAAGQLDERRTINRTINEMRQRKFAAQRAIDYLYEQARQRIDDLS
jgi:flagellar biosynthesis/type III secretory pathway protein FliH